MNISDSFINRIMIIADETTPEQIVHTVKRCIIDYFGVTLAGSVKSSGDRYSLLKEGNVPIIGTNIKTDVLYASLINGFNAHILELDDGHRYGMVHVGAIVLSAVFSVAAQEKITDPDRVIKAILCGYETTVALAKAMQPEHKMKGFHTSGTCGTVGAAMATGVLLGYDRTELKRSLSLAATSAAGLLIMMDDDSEMKPYNIGHAAMDGVASAVMGKSRWNHPIDPLGGERGFADVLSGKDIAEEDLWNGNDYYISGVYTKTYASCRHCHPSVEAALKIRSLHDIERKNACSKIERILIKTYRLAIKGHNHTVVVSEQSARMSIPYSVATALIYGESGCEAFEKDRIHDRFINELMNKVEVEEYAPYTLECPQKRIAEVEIVFSDGTVSDEIVEYPLGEPENPMTDEQIEEKSLELMKTAGMSEKRAREIIDSVWEMDKEDHFKVWEKF